MNKNVRQKGWVYNYGGLHTKNLYENISFCCANTVNFMLERCNTYTYNLTPLRPIQHQL